MSVQERVAAIILLEKIKADPEYAKRIGLEIVKHEVEEEKGEEYGKQ